MTKRFADDTFILFNVTLCLLCLTYLYFALDKEVKHVYKYAKSLDDEMVRMLNDIEVKHAAVPPVQDAQT